MKTPTQDLQSLPSEETIRSVVHAFYAKIRQDDLLSKIFESRLRGHWDEHLETMVDFWSSIILTTGRYRGRPLAVHGELGDISPEMWARWLELFGQTAKEHCDEAAASLLLGRAKQIASHLSRSLNKNRPLAVVGD